MDAGRALAGLRVVEVGQLLAGPLAGALLGYFGAEVIKLEPPGGDPIRGWRALEDGTSLWWRSLARNKRCAVVDLRRAEGQALLRELVRSSDVLLENFRPGTLEKWGLGPSELAAIAPRLIVARVSGFGQTGPDRERPGFASVCEAVAGLRHITGHPGEVPVRSNASLGDSLGGLHALIGILLALVARERTGRGQVVDVALTESVLTMLESTLMECDRLGIVREPSGATITGVVPSNVYACRDARVVIGANTDKLFVALMRSIGRADLAVDPSLSQNPGRVERAAFLDAAISAWTSVRDASEVVATLAAAGVPVGRIQDARALLSDPQFVARGFMEPVAFGAGEMRLPAFAPRLSETPGRSDWVGPELGAHTDWLLRERLGLSEARVAELRAAAVVA